MNLGQKTEYDTNDELLAEIAIEYLKENNLEVRKESLFPSRVTKDLKVLAIQEGAIPGVMGNNKFKELLMKVLNFK